MMVGVVVEVVLYGCGYDEDCIDFFDKILNFCLERCSRRHGKAEAVHVPVAVLVRRKVGVVLCPVVARHV